MLQVSQTHLRMLRTHVMPMPPARNAARSTSGGRVKRPYGPSNCTAAPMGSASRAFLKSDPRSLVVNSSQGSVGESEWEK